ncbi:hypothetical protein MIZ03_3172 [Rhodoferax lithotrophicus]|uniref:Uncharacterized protein n=1 Tax=Rhodoferax lithotrophicus TaxID=2798804 RepID=A0ABM7MQC2_9BURK|nr:hypothetical protein MIZ03_3172 [Rhodoferax sp. MIZ03]
MEDKFVGRVFAPAGDSLSFASPKESKQRKGDPAVCVPSLRYGQPAVLAAGGGPLELGYRLKQSRALIHLQLRSSAPIEGTQVPVLVALRTTLHRGAWHPPRCNARRSRASSADSYAVVRRRVAQGWADQGSRLSERSEFERDPAQTEQRSEPARSDGSAFGSPSLCLLSLGEAKKSASPAGARPGQQPHQKP